MNTIKWVLIVVVSLVLLSFITYKIFKDSGSTEKAFQKGFADWSFICSFAILFFNVDDWLLPKTTDKVIFSLFISAIILFLLRESFRFLSEKWGWLKKRLRREKVLNAYQTSRKIMSSNFERG